MSLLQCQGVAVLRSSVALQFQRLDHTRSALRCQEFQAEKRLEVIQDLFAHHQRLQKHALMYGHRHKDRYGDCHVQKVFGDAKAVVERSHIWTR